MQGCDALLALGKHYGALLFISYTASQLAQLREAARGGQYRGNIYKFLLAFALVMLVEMFVRDHAPRYVYAVAFGIAFYAEEVYDYLRNELFVRIKALFEKRYLKNDDSS